MSDLQALEKSVPPVAHGTIQELFQKYSRFTDKESVHHYGLIYEQWFGKLGNVRQALELGCNSNGGGCLLAFAERFPNAEIVGVDITLEQLIPDVREHKRIHLYQGDVYQPTLLNRFCTDFTNPLDLIVDDCLHTPDEQIKALKLWLPLLSQDGLYVIEDFCELDGLSMMLSDWNQDWSIFLGDTRNQGEYRFDSVLIGLKRVR